jgi:hypothetical protein
MNTGNDNEKVIEAETPVGATSTLADWVASHLANDATPASALEANIRLSLKAMTALNAVDCRLDEEGLTASLIGSLAASLPLSILAFGASNEAGGTFSWAQFAKGGRKPFSESRKGADFALVITLPAKRPRMAVFQAKSDWSASAKKNAFKFGHSRLEEVAGKETTVYQAQMLANYATDIMRKCRRVPKIEYANFVHYACQLETGLRCVAMSAIAAEITAFLAQPSVASQSVDVTEAKSTAFLDVLADVFEEKPKHWITLPQLDHGALLPETIDMRALAELMDLYVSDDGSGTWSNVPEGDGFAWTRVAEASAPPVSFTVPAPALPKPSLGGGRKSTL